MVKIFIPFFKFDWLSTEHAGLLSQPEDILKSLYLLRSNCEIHLSFVLFKLIDLLIAVSLTVIQSNTVLCNAEKKEQNRTYINLLRCTLSK